MIDYENFIELDNVTIGDCIDLLHMKHKRTVINDGHIITFEEDGE